MKNRPTLRTLIILFAVAAALVGGAPAARASGTISGRVTLPSGPAAEYVVWVDTDTTTAKWWGLTDANGNYTSGPLPDGHDWNVHVMVNGNPYGPQIRWDVPLGSSGVDFALRDTGGTIAGRITDASGRGVANSRVSVFDIGKTAPWSWSAAYTDSSGYYEIPRLDYSERYQVFYEGGETFVAVTEGQTTRLDIHLGKGYWIVTDRGVIHSFGSVEKFGDDKGFPQLIVSVAPTASGKGFWLLDEYGDVLTFGDAKDHGSYKDRRDAGLVGAAELVDIEPTVTGNGYYILDSAGGIHTFGDAVFRGSIPDLRQKGQQIGKAKVMAIAVTKSGNGYWILDDQGGMFTFGDARFRGSIPWLRNRGQQIGRATVVSMTPTASGNGYWMTDDQGGIFTFGDAVFKGSVPWLRLKGNTIGRATMVDMVPTPSGNGYYLIDDNGGIFTFGDAKYQGSLPAKKAGGPAIGIALTG